MKKMFLPLILSVGLIFSTTGCSIFTSKGKSAKTEEKGRAKIANVETQISANTAERIEQVATFAYGTEYALNKVSDPPKEVTFAKDMNQRVISLAGSPAVDKMKEMQATIDKLTSTLITEQNAGKKMLASKDKEIISLQNETKALKLEKDAEIQKYMLAAQTAAATADAYKGELAEYQKWMGLGGVVKGLWQFIKSMAWILGIGSILFLILRFASLSNPFAASIFAIFSRIGSWCINIIEVIVPQALDKAGQISKNIYNKSALLLKKIIDNIQNIKEIEKRTGKDITLRELMVELDKSLDVAEKEMVSQIKKEMGY
jgi:hypothetical protein